MSTLTKTITKTFSYDPEYEYYVISIREDNQQDWEEYGFDTFPVEYDSILFSHLIQDIDSNQITVDQIKIYDCSFNPVHSPKYFYAKMSLINPQISDPAFQWKINVTFTIGSTWEYKSRQVMLDDGNYARFNCNLYTPTTGDGYCADYGGGDQPNTNGVICKVGSDYNGSLNHIRNAGIMDSNATKIAKAKDWRTSYYVEDTSPKKEFFLSNFNALEVASNNSAAMTLAYTVWTKNSQQNIDKQIFCKPLLDTWAVSPNDGTLKSIFIPVYSNYIYAIWCNPRAPEIEVYNRNSSTARDENNPVYVGDSNNPFSNQDEGLDISANSEVTFEARVTNKISLVDNNNNFIRWDSKGANDCTVQLTFRNDYAEPEDDDERKITIKVYYYDNINYDKNEFATWDIPYNLSSFWNGEYFTKTFTGTVTSLNDGTGSSGNSTKFCVDVQYESITYDIQTTFYSVGSSLINSMPINIFMEFSGFKINHTGGVITSNGFLVSDADNTEDVTGSGDSSTEKYYAYGKSILVGWRSWYGYGDTQGPYSTYQLKEWIITKPQRITINSYERYTGSDTSSYESFQLFDGSNFVSIDGGGTTQASKTFSYKRDFILPYLNNPAGNINEDDIYIISYPPHDLQENHWNSTHIGCVYDDAIIAANISGNHQPVSEGLDYGFSYQKHTAENDLTYGCVNLVVASDNNLPPDMRLLFKNSSSGKFDFRKLSHTDL